MIKPTVKATAYGLNSFRFKSADDWNKLKKGHLLYTNITAETFCWEKYAKSLWCLCLMKHKV